MPKEMRDMFNINFGESLLVFAWDCDYKK
ncbi:MAG: hypothetical protein PHT03_03850 [Bacilli bacterium]|nr:hypothetical protein [Bacilli bacterium]